MERALQELIESGAPRLRRDDIELTRRSPDVVSLKASTPVTLPRRLEDSDDIPVAPIEDEEIEAADTEQKAESGPLTPSLPPIPEDGRGVVGICDCGFDFTHANLRDSQPVWG